MNYDKILFILLFLIHVCIVVDEFNGYSLLALKGIWHSFAHVRQFDFLSDGTVFKVDICGKKTLLHWRYEAFENSNIDIEGLSSHLWKI